MAKRTSVDQPRGWFARALTAAQKTVVEKNPRSYKMFVDDMRDIPSGWIGCRTVSESIAILACLPVSEISLDHDIIAPKGGGSLYQSLSTENFKGVAYYIAAMPTSDRPKVTIHTANVGAAKSMCDILGVRFEDTYRHYAPENYKED